MIDFRCAYSYDNLLSGRVIFITGVGRSGTTILARMLRSMAPIYYFNEPMLFNLMPMGPSTPIIFYDDYAKINIMKSFLQGRIEGLDPPRKYNPLGYPESNRGVANFLEDVNPFFVVKLVNSQPYIGKYMELFPGSTCIHIVRNGIDVIRSAAELGWYGFENGPPSKGDIRRFWRLTEGPFNEMVHPDSSCNVPWYVPSDEVDIWKSSNMVTRLAHSWSILVQSAGKSFAYEDFCKHPKEFAETIRGNYGLQITGLMQTCIDDIINHKVSVYPQLSLDDIGEPVREKFAIAMEKMGYELK